MPERSDERVEKVAGRGERLRFDQDEGQTQVIEDRAEYWKARALSAEGRSAELPDPPTRDDLDYLCDRCGKWHPKRSKPCPAPTDQRKACRCERFLGYDCPDCNPAPTDQANTPPEPFEARPAITFDQGAEGWGYYCFTCHSGQPPATRRHGAECGNCGARVVEVRPAPIDQGAGHPADRFADLKEDWDSYGAKQITPEAIKAAKALWFVPLPNGGIQVEAHLAGGEIEFEINPDGSLGECLYEPIDQEADDAT